MNPLRRLWNQRPWRRRLRMDQIVFNESQTIAPGTRPDFELFKRDAIPLIKSWDGYWEQMKESNDVFGAFIDELTGGRKK